MEVRVALRTTMRLKGRSIRCKVSYAGACVGGETSLEEPCEADWQAVRMLT